MKQWAVGIGMGLLATAAAAETPLLKLRFEVPRPQMAMQLPGASHHLDAPRRRGQTWNEQHPGLGLEWRYRLGPHTVMKRSLGLMQDSLAMWGGYGGSTVQQRLYDNHQWVVDAGAGAFVLYRSMAFQGRRDLHPAVFPVLSVEHGSSGWGFNLMGGPSFSTDKQSMPGLVYMQLVKRM